MICSSQVVAPVRETCAQTLGVALAQMKAERALGVAKVLGLLARHAQWEARHGALLGFKYLLAARQVSGYWAERALGKVLNVYPIRQLNRS